MQPEIWFGLGALVLLLVLGWATMQTRTRNRRNDAVTQQATKELYQNPENYESKREELKKDLEPQDKDPGTAKI